MKELTTGSHGVLHGVTLFFTPWITQFDSVKLRG
jgi:hypothetical protein